MGTRDLFFLQVSWNPPCFAKAGPCSARRSVPSAPPELSQSVLRDFAKIRIGASDSKFVLPAPFEEAVAAQAAIEECRDRAGLLVGQGYLAKKIPSRHSWLSRQSIVETCNWLTRNLAAAQRVDGWSGNNDLFDRIERSVLLGGYRATHRMFACLSEGLRASKRGGQVYTCWKSWLKRKNH